MKPRMLDLFSGAGGAARGYQQAGFHVTGVDINPQPRYAGDVFIQGDALEYLAQHGHEYDSVHASPPCQDHSPLSALVGKHGTGWLLDATLAALRAGSSPWIVENVMGADMGADIVLCGTMFGLRTYRHRKFSIDPRVTMMIEAPHHPLHRVRASTKKRRKDFDAGMFISITGDVGSYLGPACMGIDWMNGNELSQAIPPPYTEFIGAQLLRAITTRTAS